MKPITKAILLILLFVAVAAFGLWEIDHGLSQRGYELTPVGHMLLSIASFVAGYGGTWVIMTLTVGKARR